MNSDINGTDKASSPFLANSSDNTNSTQGYSHPTTAPGSASSGNSPPYTYPQPGNPYPYNSQHTHNIGFQPQIQPNNSTNDAIMATQALNAAIHQNGRTPITVVCPSCRNTVVTEITEVENNTIGQGQSKVIYIFSGGTLIVFLAFFIAVTFISGSFIPLAIMPVFIIFILVGFFLMRSAGKNAAKMCTDVQHHCSSCKVLLGVSSGAQVYQQMQRLNYRRRV